MRGFTRPADVYEDESSGACQACPRQPDAADSGSIADGFAARPGSGQHVPGPRIRWREWRSYGI
jgi:hypothetical protein